MIKIISNQPEDGVTVDYPKLMEVIINSDNIGTVVLFHEYKKGTVIKGVNFWSGREGEYNTKWAMENFADYNEPITIQNA